MARDEALSFYSLVERSADGVGISFEKFRNKVVYGVNVAPHCNRSEEDYAILATLSEGNFKDMGVEVAIFPSLQFNGQDEPSLDPWASVKYFNKFNNEINATIFEVGDVNGPHARPAYAYMDSHRIFRNTASGNFVGKFIVKRDGTGSN
jgi:glutathione peroxidase-family protein